MIYHTNEFFDKQFNLIIKLINDSKSSDNCIHNIITTIKKYYKLNNFIKLIKHDDFIFKKFIELCNIDYELYNTIKNEIYKVFNKKYKEIYCVEYKLILIFQLRNTVVKWVDLTKSIFYDPINSKHHYKSIHSQFLRWSNNKIFKNAFLNCVPYNNTLTTNNLSFNDNDEHFYIINSDNDLFIDATSINNKLGSEAIVINPELKKKKITKISTISNINGFIYSILPFDINDKTITFNKKKRIIKTSVNDSKSINNSINNINHNIIINSNNINLIGDKGYITNDKIKYKNKNVNIITPIKKNCKNKFIFRQNKKMLFRYIIENTICSIKRDERINIRKDKKINTFMSWIYISSLDHNLKNNNRLKNEILSI